MFCSECGHYIPDGAKFCPDCGAMAEEEDQPQSTYQSQNAYQSQNVAYNTQHNYEEPQAQTYEEPSADTAEKRIDGNQILSLIGPHKGLTAGCCMIWIGCVVALFSIIFNPAFYTISYGGRVDGWYLSTMDMCMIIIVAIVAIAVVTIFKLYSVDVIGVMALIITTCMAIGTGLSEIASSGYDYTFSLELGGVLMISSILTIAIGSVYGMMETMRNEDK